MYRLPTTEKHGAWPADAAVRHLTADVPVFTEEKTLQEIEAHLRKTVDQKESVNFIYLVNGSGKLTGVLSIKDLFRHPPAATAGSVARREPLVKIRAGGDQERAAYLALKHNIKAVPVVDHEDRLLGVISSDAILTILYHELREDMLRLTGIHHRRAVVDDILKLPLGQAIWHRLPWLFIGLCGGLLAAQIIQGFETTLQQNLVLAAFIPLIVYMSDAVGTQMEAFLIRDLALDRHLPFWRYFSRQLFVIASIGLLFSALLMGAAYLFYGDAKISAVLSLSLFAAVLSSVTTGLLVPAFFSRLRMDPANASGPVATVIQDLLSIIIYFSIATWLL